MHVNPWARLLFWFIVLLVFAFAGTAFAIELGKAQALGITVCLTKEDAVKLLTIEKEQGKEAAEQFFVSSENCANLPIEFTPQRVVTSVRTERGLGRVVEILSGEKTAYWVTYRTLKGHKEV